MPHGSLSQFKATLARKKERDNKRDNAFEKKGSIYKTPENKPSYKFPELSDSELEEVKSNIRKKIRLDRIKHNILVLILFLIVVISFFFIVDLL